MRSSKVKLSFSPISLQKKSKWKNAVTSFSFPLRTIQLKTTFSSKGQIKQIHPQSWQTQILVTTQSRTFFLVFSCPLRQHLYHCITLNKLFLLTIIKVTTTEPFQIKALIASQRPNQSEKERCWTDIHQVDTNMTPN